MNPTLETLEKRLTTLEQDVARLRRLLEIQDSGETPEDRGARLLAQAKKEKPRWRECWLRALEQMGITVGPPVPPETLRQMMAQDGIRPEERLFSRGIMEMREE